MKKHGDKKKSLWSDATALEGPRVWTRERDQKTCFGSCLERSRAMADVLREKRGIGRAYMKKKEDLYSAHK